MVFTSVANCTPIDAVNKRANPTMRMNDASTPQLDGGSSDASDAMPAGGNGGRDQSGGAGGKQGGGGMSSSQGGSGAARASAGMHAATSGAGGEPDHPAAGGGELPTDPPLSTEPLDPTITSIAAETSDVESLNLLGDWAQLPVFGTGQYLQQSSHDRGVDNASEAMVFTVTAHGNRDFDNFICRSSDADLGSGALVPYAYDMPNCTESYVRGAELARFEGSGRLMRLWLTDDTLFNNGQPANEMLRIYVDDNPRAAIQVPLQQVLNGGAGEIFTIPFGAIARTYIAWHYPVVFSSKLVVALDHLSAQYYYQADAVLDAQTQRRVAPRQRASQRDAAHAKLSAPSPLPPSAAALHSESLMLGPGEMRAVSIAGPVTVEELQLRVPKDKLASLAPVVLSVKWDGAAQPAINLAILDLFNASHAVVELSDLALASSVEGDDQVLSLRLPMPFSTSSDWTIKNSGSDTVSLQLDWSGEKLVPSAPFGHLTVQVNDAPLPTSQLEQPVATVSGQGRFVGVCGDLGGHGDNGVTGVSSNLDMMQGDFRALADGRKVIDSTGTEDYADSAYYFRDSPKATPFAQNWGRVDDNNAKPPGQVSFCRWQVLGSEIDFQHEFKAIHEMSQYNTSIVERHHTAAYLYLP